MDRSFIFVGIGGCIGSVLRYWLALIVGREMMSSFPFGTMIVNILGCFVIGVLAGLSERGTLLSTEVRILLTTGFCGGFTTFSTFSYESISLMQDCEFFYLGANVALSVFLGLFSTYLGILLIRWL